MAHHGEVQRTIEQIVRCIITHDEVAASPEDAGRLATLVREKFAGA